MKPWSACEAALAEAGRLVTAGDLAAAFSQLQRAHVLAQRDFGPHLRVHLRMLSVAWARRDGTEVRGQLLRIVLTPLGHLTGRLPRGNTGASSVSAFAPMAVSAELAQLLNDEHEGARPRS
ncbi:MAG TPA: DUF3703 domain-containing protein [Rubrivivax sp.]